MLMRTRATLRATATYTDGQGSGKTAELVTARVAAPPPTNAAPVFPDSENGQRELREDAVNGAAVEGPVQATDLNNDALTYSLAGSDSDFFTIEPNGQLSLELEPDESLDYERKSTYRFTVRVSDGANDAGEADDPDNLRIDDTITVTVNSSTSTTARITARPPQSSEKTARPPWHHSAPTRSANHHLVASGLTAPTSSSPAAASSTSTAPKLRGRQTYR